MIKTTQLEAKATKATTTMRSQGSSKISKGKIFETLDKNKEQGLGDSIKYFSSFKGTLNEYVKDSREIMTKLHNKFKDSSDLYMLWVRYFDVLEKLEGNYGSGDTEAKFKEENTKLVQQLLLVNKQGLGTIDWRIAKKMLAIESVFQEDTININIQDLLKVIKKEFSKIAEHLLWEDSTKPNIKLTKEVADKLEKYFDLAQKDKDALEKLETAIITGRFDKEDFALPGTVIMGEDGGTYLLINNTTLNKNTNVDVKEIITEFVGKDYLEDKIEQKTKDTGKVEQITIGKGGFGTVRFGLSIFDSKSNPGDLICIKKTKNFDTLRDEAKGDIKPTPLEQVIDGTIGDYFTSDISGLIHAPKVYDLSLVTSREAGDSHQKGYL
jgi:hypothetical protein